MVIFSKKYAINAEIFWMSIFMQILTLISVNGHAVATATRNSQYGSLRSNKQSVPYQYQDQYDSFEDRRSTNQNLLSAKSVRYENSYGPDSESDSEDEVDKMKREIMERGQDRQGSTSESDLDEREQDQMIPRIR